LIFAASVAIPLETATQGARVSVEPSPSQRSRRLTHADYQALGAFRHALRKFLAFSEAGAVALGVTPQQHQALLAVRAHPGPGTISVGELADCLIIKNHSALGLVDRLVARGLITRTPAPEDRRRVSLSLTAEGARLLETISRNNMAQLKSTLPIFTDLIEAVQRLDTGPKASSQSVPRRPRAPLL
jgi:DNA-binding MarR family transcriptional regulator